MVDHTEPIPPVALVDPAATTTATITATLPREDKDAIHQIMVHLVVLMGALRIIIIQQLLSHPMQNYHLPL